MYQINIKNNNTLTSFREHIYYRTTGVNVIQILVEPFYENFRDRYDMSKFQCLLEYKMPISKRYSVAIIDPEPDLYKDKLLQFIFPIDARFTSEVGPVEMQITFAQAIFDEDGNITGEIVRKVLPTKIKIYPTAAWADEIQPGPDSELGSITSILLDIQAKLKRQEELTAALKLGQVDDLTVDPITSKLYASAKGIVVGDGIDLNDLGDILSETTEEGLVKVLI